MNKTILIEMVDKLLQDIETEYYDMNHDCCYSVEIIEKIEKIREYIGD